MNGLISRTVSHLGLLMASFSRAKGRLRSFDGFVAFLLARTPSLDIRWSGCRPSCVSPLVAFTSTTPSHFQNRNINAAAKSYGDGLALLM